MWTEIFFFTLSVAFSLRGFRGTRGVGEEEAVSERRPRVLLADDHPTMLEGLRKALKPDFEVVGAVANGRVLVDAAAILRPDLVVTEISMPEIDGIEATRRLQVIVPETRVLILSIHTGPSWVRAAFDAGAYAYLPKTATLEEIEGALREVLHGCFYVSPVVTRAVLGSAVVRPAGHLQGVWRATRGALTRRELDIVRLVGRGLGNKEIAHELGVSVTTVRTHLSKIYEKLGPGRVELALYASHSGETVM
jgi:DNA-binding NarL/FixJ family response regulator